MKKQQTRRTSGGNVSRSKPTSNNGILLRLSLPRSHAASLFFRQGTDGSARRVSLTTTPRYVRWVFIPRQRAAIKHDSDAGQGTITYLGGFNKRDDITCIHFYRLSGFHNFKHFKHPDSLSSKVDNIILLSNITIKLLKTDCADVGTTDAALTNLKNGTFEMATKHSISKPSQSQYCNLIEPKFPASRPTTPKAIKSLIKRNKLHLLREVRGG